MPSRHAMSHTNRINTIKSDAHQNMTRRNMDDQERVRATRKAFEILLREEEEHEDSQTTEKMSLEVLRLRDEGAEGLDSDTESESSDRDDMSFLELIFDEDEEWKDSMSGSVSIEVDDETDSAWEAAFCGSEEEWEVFTDGDEG